MKLRLPKGSAKCNHTSARWKNLLERYGYANLNKNRKFVLHLQQCCNNGLRIMKTFFKHREVHKHNWCIYKAQQRWLNDFCIVSADRFPSIVNGKVKRVAQPSTDHHQVVCNLMFLETLEPPIPRKTNWPTILASAPVGYGWKRLGPANTSEK